MTFFQKIVYEVAIKIGGCNKGVHNDEIALRKEGLTIALGRVRMS